MSHRILDTIVATTRADVLVRESRTSLDELRGRMAIAPPVRSLSAALRPEPYAPARVIAEIKRSSPSRGAIALGTDASAQAAAYARGGAAAISVLTERHHFRGSLADLEAVRAVSPVPVLRKDFVVTPYQVYEARASGADAVLLICAILDDARLTGLLALTHDLGMEALVEAHDEAEVVRAIASGASIIGVNARDLGSFSLDRSLPARLSAIIPPECIYVSESGILGPRDIARARAWGADAVLVGETLMRADAPCAMTRLLARAGGGAAGTLLGRRRAPFVKICGLASEEHVQLAARLHADAFGLVFAPMAPSHRRVDLARARALVAARPDGGPMAVGVFVNEALDEIRRIASGVPLDAIQLSGDETPTRCAAVAAATRLPVLKALRIVAQEDLTFLDEYLAAGAIPLLDAARAGSYGGTGQLADWALAAEAAQRMPVILAGGLGPDTVATALAATHAKGVDVSSGVERVLAKDTGLIERFIMAARGSAMTEGASR
ncbi:MAG TPA: indole-3-glycerol phosphate synthase TrpC [Ktedonobacterales bacterium]